MKRSLVPILLIVLLDVFGYTALIPLLPFYAEHFGAGPVVLGFLVMLYAICQLLSGPVLGHLSDRFGRKRLLLVSQCGTLMSFLGLAYSRSLAWIFIARSIDGLTSGNITIAQAWLADHTEPSERSKVFGYTGAIFGLGFLVGPALSAALFTRGGYRLPLLVSAALSATSLTSTLLLLPKSAPAQVPGKKLEWGDLLPFARVRLLLESPKLYAPACQFALFALAFSLYLFGIPLFAERRLTVGGHPFGPREVGWLFAYSATLNLGVQLKLIGPIVARFGERRIVRTAFALSAVGFVLLTFATGPWTLILAATFFCVGNGTLRPSLMGLVSRESERAHHGAVLGVVQSFYSMADITGPVFGGWLISRELFFVWTGLIAFLMAMGAGTEKLFDLVRRAPGASGLPEALS